MKNQTVKSVMAGLIACLVALSVFVLVLVSIGLPEQAKASPSAAPLSVVNVGYQIFAVGGITQTVTGTSIYLPAYTADCYQTVVLTGAQGIQLSIQHSPNNSTWVNLDGFSPSSVTHTVSVTTATTSVAFSPTLTFYGTWIRGIATLTGTTPVNASIVCTFHS